MNNSDDFLLTVTAIFLIGLGTGVFIGELNYSSAIDLFKEQVSVLQQEKQELLIGNETALKQAYNQGLTDMDEFYACWLLVPEEENKICFNRLYEKQKKIGLGVGGIE
jgi:hypothetical protein